jgi:hypothetical protein
MNLKFSFRLLLVMLLLCGSANAQEFFKTNTSGGGFNVMFGNQAFGFPGYFNKDSADLSYAFRRNTENKSIDSSFFSRPEGGLTTLGFQGFGIYNSFIMGGELRLGIGRFSEGRQSNYDSTGKRTDKGITRARGLNLNVMFNAGYVVLRKRGLIVYPMVGAGWALSGIHLNNQAESGRIYPKITGIVTETSSNIQHLGVFTSSPCLDFGLGAQYFFGRSTEDNAKGISLGFRFGYNLQFQTNAIKVNWFKNASDNPNWVNSNPVLPKVGSNGLYFLLTLGFGRAGENL